jgi:hypothetical protein
MKCIGGPIDGGDLPDTGEEFLLITFYDRDSSGRPERTFIYWQCDEEWRFDRRMTENARDGMRDEQQKRIGH